MNAPDFPTTTPPFDELHPDERNAVMALFDKRAENRRENTNLDLLASLHDEQRDYEELAGVRAVELCDVYDLPDDWDGIDA